MGLPVTYGLSISGVPDLIKSSNGVKVKDSTKFVAGSLGGFNSE